MSGKSKPKKDKPLRKIRQPKGKGIIALSDMKKAIKKVTKQKTLEELHKKLARFMVSLIRENYSVNEK